jgi:phage tail-like protein
MSGESFPLASFYFSVEIGGTTLSFQEVTGLEMKIEYETSEDNQEEKMPTKRTFGNITFKRGFMPISAYKSTIFEWFNTNFNPDEGSKVDPKKIEIFMLDPEGEPVMYWTAEKAWPVKWSFSALNASKNELSIESLEFTVNKLDFKLG